ncbi:MAG TPA: methyltransferase domain-containing protein [Gaiellaceae bacterium]|nr:methyltransferase domain-containing protein [Gaiellaceae bacterium]
MTVVLPENEEAQRAWDGVLFDRFLQFRYMIGELARHGHVAMQHCPPPAGARVVDLGCGLGDSAVELGELVGPDGSVLGVDISPRFIELARKENAGPNVRFEVMDVQAAQFDETYDYAFSRFGTMFFASPVAALRNIHRALEPGGRLVSVVWRRREDNPWLYEAEQVVKPLIEIPEETDEARCGPGPFSMAGADTASTQLQLAGFRNVSFLRSDLPLKLGVDVEQAIELNLALGPAAEAVRLAGDAGEAMRPKLRELLTPVFTQFLTDEGVVAGSSVWVITATA